MNMPIRIRTPGIKKAVYIGNGTSFQTSSFPSGPDAEVSLQHLEGCLIVVLFGPQKPDEECVAYITVEVLLPLYQVPASKHVHQCPHGCGSGSGWFWEDRSGSVLEWKLYPDPHWSKNSGALEAQNEAKRAVDAHNGAAEAQNAAVEGLYTSGRKFGLLGWGAGSESGSA